MAIAVSAANGVAGQLEEDVLERRELGAEIVDLHPVLTRCIGSPA